MELKTKQNLLEAKSKEILFLRLALLITGTATLCLSCLMIYAFNHAEKIIVPAGFNAPAAISNSTVSASYLTQTTQSLLFDRYSVTPENVDELHSLLLFYIAADSKFYSAFSTILEDEASDIKSQQIVGAFYISNMTVDDSHLRVKVTGTLKKSTELVGHNADNTLPDESKKFLLQYQYKNGLLQLTNWSEETNEKS